MGRSTPHTTCSHATARRVTAVIAVSLATIVVTAGAAAACGSLVAANGAVDLERTTTLAAYHDGVEEYITGFEFESDQSSFGSIIPLPGRPTTVERGGAWTLQRLEREVRPPQLRKEVLALGAPAARDATVLQQVRIDSLDVTILRGGGRAVARWATKQGFDLTADVPDILDFYARRSPFFMAARYDAGAALAQGLRGGDGTPVHLTIPTDNPWVPLRILAAGMPRREQINADVFLLTHDAPRLLHGDGLVVERSERASKALLDDLRADESSSWVPRRSWLTYARVDSRARDLTYDLAIDVHGTIPSFVDTGLVGPSAITPRV
jgi:hypothetical protein